MPRAGGLYFESHGPSDAPALVLSPGLGGLASYWAPNLPALTGKYRVIVYDHRGTGRSDRTLPPRLRIGDMAQDVLTVMDAAAVETVSLIGHAAGGLIGLSLAATAPSRVEKLVVVNGWARLDAYTARCFDIRLALLRDSGVETYLHAQPIFLYPPDWASVHSDKLDAQAEADQAEFPGVATVEQRIAALRAFDAATILEQIMTPVLVLAAADDGLVPAHCARDLADALPNATRMLQFSGGHACNVTEPEQFHDRVLPWLAGETFPEE